MHLVRKVSARPIHQWSRMVCVSVGQGWPTLCVCVLPQVWGRILPTTDSMSVADYQNHNRVLRDKRVIWENVIGVIASSVWACKLYEGWACLSVLVKVKLELHVSYHMYCPPFFKLWHKKSIKPFFSSNCHHSLTISLSPRYQDQRKLRCYFQGPMLAREVIFLWESGAYFPKEPGVYFPPWEPDARGDVHTIAPPPASRGSESHCEMARPHDDAQKCILHLILKKVEHLTSFQHIGFLCIV